MFLNVFTLTAYLYFFSQLSYRLPIFPENFLLLIFDSIEHIKFYNVLSLMNDSNIFPVHQICFKLIITEDFRLWVLLRLI